MTTSLAEDLYPRLPVVLQNVVCSFYGWRESRYRFGKSLEQPLEELLRSEWLPRGDIEAFQDERLAKLVAHAYAHVPYYRESMRAAGLVPADIRSRADLPKLPLLGKEDVRSNERALLSETAERGRLLHRRTSGTTGKSLHLYAGKDAVAFQWAVWWRHRTRFDLWPGEWHANFTGKPVVPPEQSSPPYWRWNGPMRQAVLNMQHLTPAKIEPIARFLDRQAFSFWAGYPSILHALALAALERGVSLERPPRVITSGAEKMLDFQRRDLSAVTGATITDQYGQTEACGNASHCAELVYHEDFEFGFLECVEPEPLGDGRIRGRLVCTGYGNPDFPLIRYDTGDSAVWAPAGHRCSCGRESAVLLEIEGRIEDYVLTPEGRRIMRFDYVFKDARNVNECQVVQRAPDSLTLRIVRRDGYGTSDEQHLRDEVATWISPRLEVDFEYVDEIEREPSGKFRAVKSLLR
jgi:phenylacetate-CoA ligase